jgi:hypothetical protein
VFADFYDRVDEVLASVSEIKLAYYSVQDNVWTINVELYPESERDVYGGRVAFAIEEQLLGDLRFLTSS